MTARNDDDEPGAGFPLSGWLKPLATPKMANKAMGNIPGSDSFVTRHANPSGILTPTAHGLSGAVRLCPNRIWLPQ